MSRGKIFTLLLLVAGTIVVMWAASGKSVEAQSDDVSALKAKVAQLEGELSQCQTKLGQAGALENDAQVAYGELQKLISAGDYAAARDAYKNFQTKYAATRVGRSARRLGAELEVLGKSSPSQWGIERWFQGEDQVDLASGKPTLLVFWEVWCPHCQREVPKMQKMYDDHKAQGLQVVGVTRITKSSTPEKVEEFIVKQKVGYPIVKEDGKLAAYFNVSGIPAAAMLKDGKVVWRGHPAQLTEQMLAGWM